MHNEDLRFDIFAACIVNPEINSVNQEKDCISNFRMLKSKFSKNIFTGVYYILYEALLNTSKFGANLTKHQLENIIRLSADELIHNPQVDIHSLVTDEEGGMLNLKDENDANIAKQGLLNATMAEFYKLQAKTISVENFRSSLELYLNNLKNEDYAKILQKTYEIYLEGTTTKFGKQIGVEAAHDYYRKAMAQLQSKIVVDVEDGTNGVESGSEGLNKFLTGEHNTSRPVTNFGLEVIDSVIGDLRTTQVVTIIGPSGSGKSRNAAALVHTGLLRGHSALIISRELPEDEWTAMIIARHLYVKFNLFISDDQIIKNEIPEDCMNSYRAAVTDLFMNPKYGEFKVIDEDVTVENYKDYVETIYDTWRPFDILCDDYISLMGSSTGKTQYQIVTEAFKEAKRICKKLDVLGIFPHQMKQETIKEILAGKSADTTSGAESGESIKSSDQSIAVFSTKEMNAKNQIAYMHAKARRTRMFPDFIAVAWQGVCTYSDLSMDGV